MKGVVRELEIEERRFGFLELAGGGQHIVGQPRRLGHRDIDDDQQFQRLERVAHRGRVGDGMRGVAALDDHRPEPVRMVGQDLLRHHVGRQQPGDDGSAGHRRAADAARREQRRE